MTKDDTYNGWRNHSTWAVHLWMTSNDESTYRHWQETARATYRSARASAHLTQREQASQDLARAIEAEHAENCPIEGASVYTDLLTSALGVVDWQEIAVAFLDAEIPVEDEVEEETETEGENDAELQ